MIRELTELFQFNRTFFATIVLCVGTHFCTVKKMLNSSNISKILPCKVCQYNVKRVSPNTHVTLNSTFFTKSAKNNIAICIVRTGILM